MTLKELLAKNAAIAAERNKKDKKEEKPVKKAVEKKPIVKEEKKKECEREKEELVIEEPKEEEQARGEKPANREYMVVEDQDAIKDF